MGIRLVGIFVPWQAVALTLSVVVGLTALVASRGGDPATVRVEQASGEVADPSEPSPEPAPSLEATTTTTAAPPPTTTTMPAPSSTTTPAPSSTTTVPPTTTTTIAPGAAEVVIMGGGVSNGFGSCSYDVGDWSFFNNCVAGGPPRADLTFSLDPRRYPASSTFRFDVAGAIWHDTTFCLRLWNLTRNEPVGGSEKCWSAPAATPQPYVGYPPQPTFSEPIGPVSFSPGSNQYTIQGRAFSQSTGQGCSYDAGHCSELLDRAKIVIEWG